MSEKGIYASYEPSALLLIERRMSSRCPLMESHLPTDFGAHPERRSQGMSVWISPRIQMGTARPGSLQNREFTFALHNVGRQRHDLE
jgi:hypothetical protein